MRPIILFLTLISLFSCDKKEERRIWDISPIVVTINVVDAKGNDLLNPETLNRLDLTKIKAICGDEEYVCNEDVESKTRYYMPSFYGLKSVKGHEGLYNLEFGEFNGAQSYTNKEVTIVWENGSTDKISFNRNYTTKKNGDPVIKDEWFLNGVKATSRIFKLTK